MKCCYSNGQTRGLKIETKKTKWLQRASCIKFTSKWDQRAGNIRQSYDIDCGGIFPLIYFADMEGISFLIRYARSIQSAT